MAREVPSLLALAGDKTFTEIWQKSASSKKIIDLMGEDLGEKFVRIKLQSLNIKDETIEGFIKTLRVQEITIAEFRTLLQALQRIPLRSRQKQLSLWKLFCLLGTKKGVDHALEVIKGSGQTVASNLILANILLTNNRSLLLETNKALRPARWWSKLFGHRPSLEIHNVKFSAGVDFSYLDLHDIYFSNVDFIQTNFTGANFSGVNIGNNVNFTGANFSDVDLRKVKRLKYSNCTKAKFLRANLSGMDLEKGEYDFARWAPKLEEADFSGAILTGATLLGANCTKAKFADAEMRRVNLSQTKLNSADFTRANLQDATLGGWAFRKNINFSSANLERADFYRQTGPRWYSENHRVRSITAVVVIVIFAPIWVSFFLASEALSFFFSTLPEYLSDKLDDVDENRLDKNKLDSHYMIKPIFTGANAKNTNFHRVTMREGKLEGTNLSGANLSKVRLVEPEIKNVNFANASMGFWQNDKPRIRNNNQHKIAGHYLPMMSGDNKETLIKLWENYVAGRFLVGTNFRSHVPEVKKLLEFADSKENYTAEELVGKLVDEISSKNVNYKGDLYTMMDEFCRVQLGRSFDNFLMEKVKEPPGGELQQDNSNRLVIAAAA